MAQSKCFQPVNKYNLEISRKVVPKLLPFLWLCTWMSAQYPFVLYETMNFFWIELNWIEIDWNRTEKYEMLGYKGLGHEIMVCAACLYIFMTRFIMLYWNSQDVKQHVKMKYDSLDGFLPRYISCIRSCFWRHIWKCTFPWCLSNNLMFGNDTHGVGSDSIEACRYTSICCGCWPISYNGWPCIYGCQGSILSYSIILTLW